LKVGHLTDPLNADQDKVKEIELKRSKHFGSVANFLQQDSTQQK
jgi:hypothetical protein